MLTEQLAHLTERAEPEKHGAHIAVNDAFTRLSLPAREDPEALLVEIEKSAEVRAGRTIFDGL